MSSGLIPGYEASQWFGLVAPKGMPAGIIDTLNAGVDAGLADTQLQGRLVELGETVVARSAAEFGRRIGVDADKWANVIQTANVKI
jgi:tripartite-type tricarboxylate transporter receptor subunit TctC